MRLYPTLLTVVKSSEHLIEKEENVKGYFDAKSKNVLQIGVRGSSRIYLNSPGNWYRAYTFKITGISANQSSNGETNRPKEANMEQLIKIKVSDEPDELWILVAEVLRDRLGRTPLHMDNDHFLTITNINSSMAKDAYYAFKNILKTKGYEFTVNYHLLSNPMSKGMLPDIRPYRKAKQHKKKNPSPKKNDQQKIGSNPYDLLKTNVYC